MKNINLKKIVVLIVLAIISILVQPSISNVKAAYNFYGISDYYIDAKVEPNGDLYVKELVVLEGKYNGFNKILEYKNPNATHFDGTINSFFGSDIYDASNIEIIKIQAKTIDKNKGFDNLYNEGINFNQTKSASKGDFGFYTLTNKANGLDMLIYNPSTKGYKGFYTEYKIKDLAINHNDVSEIGWNIIGKKLTENIGNLTLKLNIPTNKKTIKVWGHGPLNGETKIIDKNNIQLTISQLLKKTAIDVRVVFDSKSINAKKKTNVDALNKIIKFETQKADEANQEREQAYQRQVLIAEQKVALAKEQHKMSLYEDAYETVVLLRDSKEKTNMLNELETIYKEIRNKQIKLSSIMIIYLIFLIFLVVKYYKKYDKEDIPSFKGTHYRDFPQEYGPEIVYYLFNQDVKPICLSATLLNLIDKKVIDYQKVDNDYRFISKIDIKTIEQSNLTQGEIAIMNWLFSYDDRNNQVLLSTLKKEATSSYNEFLTDYKNYEHAVIKEAKSYNFFWQNHSIGGYLLGSILGIILAMFLSVIGETYTVSSITFIMSVASIIYYNKAKKRTKNGNEDYAKWKGLKRFIQNFGRFKERDLPQIELWNKYLVYALIFGVADKLAKEMEFKVNELKLNPQLVDYNRFYMFKTFNYALENSISTAKAEEYKANHPDSTSSSGSGLGGGFSGGSFGGGGFSGGSGGGRF